MTFLVLYLGTLMSLTGLGPAAPFSRQVLLNLPVEAVNNLEFLFSSADKSETPLMQRSVNELLRYKMHSLYNNTTPIAAQVDEAIEKARGLKGKDRIALLKKAIKLSPILPETRFMLAKAYLSDNSGNTPSAVSSFVDGLGRTFSYLPGLFVSLGNISFYLVQGISLAVLLFVLSLFLRNMPLLGHEIVDLIPGLRINAMDVWDPHEHYVRLKRHTDRLGSLLVIVVFFIPLALGLGLLPSALLWLVILGLHMKGKELAHAIFVVVMVSLVPLLGLQVGTTARLQNNPGPALYYCGNDECSKADVSIITKSKTAIDKKTKYLALAINTLHRTVKHPEATDEARRLVEKMPDSAEKFILLGNISLIDAFTSCQETGKARKAPNHRYLNEARDWYDKATQMTSDTAPLYGLSLIAAYRSDHEAMDRLQRRIVSLTPEEDLDDVARLREELGGKDFCKDLGAVLGALRNPDYPWNKAYISNVNFFDSPMILPFHRILMGKLPKMIILFMGPVTLLLLILAFMVGQGLPLAHRCPKCSTISCKKCNLKATGFDYCPTCLLSQVKGGMIGQEEAFLLRRKNEASRRRTRLINLVSALLLPGTGQVADGGMGMGLFLLFSVSILLFWIAYPWPPFMNFRTFTGFSSIKPSLLPPILLMIVYTISWVDAWRRQSR